MTAVLSPFFLAPAAPAGPYGSHVAWRLQIDANNGNATDTAFSEFKFYDQSSAQITTSGGTAFAGGSGSGGTPGNLFDGNLGTTWDRSSPTNTFCGYIFSSAQAVASIDLYTSTSTNAAPKTCRLQYSDDTTNGTDGTWTTAFEIWEPSWPASGAATRTWPQDFTGGKHKAYRWNVTANNGDRFYIQNEAELHTSHGGSDITGSGRAFSSNNAGTGTSPDSLFDNNTSTHFDWDGNAGQIPGQVGYYLETTYAINEYSLNENNATTRGWNSWTFQYSDDGVTWTTLDTQSGITWSSIPQTKTFSF